MRDEFFFTHEARTFRCRVESVNVATSGTALPSNAHWSVEVDGIWSQAFDSSPDDTEESVGHRVVEWDQSRRARMTHKRHSS